MTGNEILKSNQEKYVCMLLKFECFVKYGPDVISSPTIILIKSSASTHLSQEQFSAYFPRKMHVSLMYMNMIATSNIYQVI